MSQLFTSRQFADFGPSYLFPLAPPRPVQQIVGARAGSLRRQVRELCSRQPGVYGMLDRHGELIYIGKAKNLRARLLCYFRPRSRDPKAGRILNHTASLVWEVSDTEFAALHRELELIRRWRPRFNVQGQPDYRRPAYVCVGRPPAPYVFLAQRPPREVLAWYGPVVSGRRVRAAVRRLNDWFQLRDCPQSQEMIFADHRELFPLELSPGCLRHEIGTCLGPCAAACSRQDYFAQVRAVRAFLEGKGLWLLNTIETEMTTAATRQQYERAALLRDQWAVLSWLHQHLDRLRQLRTQGSFIYPLPGWDGTTVWYLIHAGQTVAALPAPRDPDSRRQAAQLIKAFCRPDRPATGQTTLAQRDSILLVASWFRRYPKEQKRRLRTTAVLADLEKKG